MRIPVNDRSKDWSISTSVAQLVIIYSCFTMSEGDINAYLNCGRLWPWYDMFMLLCIQYFYVYFIIVMINSSLGE